MGQKPATSAAALRAVQPVPISERLSAFLSKVVSFFQDDEGYYGSDHLQQAHAHGFDYLVAALCAHEKHPLMKSQVRCYCGKMRAS
jgi:hypothetical protein